MPRFSLRVLVALVAVPAIALAVLRNPYSDVADNVGVAVAAATALAAFMAVGSGQPSRSFWLAFLVGVFITLWNSHSQTSRSWGLPRVASDVASRVDGYLGWSTPPSTTAIPVYIERERITIQTFDEEGTLTASVSKPVQDATAADLERAIVLPNPAAFRSIFIHLTALLFGLLGGWIAWAARRRAMRIDSVQPPAG